MKRWATVLLIVSLVVNIFLVGAIAGSVWHWTHDRGIGLRGGWRMRAADALPEPQGDAFREAVHGTMRASLPVIKGGRAARADAARLFVQPQFDAAAVTADLDRARAADMVLRTNLEHQVVSFAATLPQEQREKLAEALRAGPLRQGKQGGATDH